MIHRVCTAGAVAVLLAACAAGSGALADEPAGISAVVSAPESEPFVNVVKVMDCLKKEDVGDVSVAVAGKDAKGITVEIRAPEDTPAGRTGELIKALQEAGVKNFKFSAIAEDAWQPFSFARLKESKERMQPALVFCRADWCAVCRAVESQVLSKKEVREALRAGACTLLRADFTDAGGEVKKFFDDVDIDAIPTLVLIGADGQTVDVREGSFTAEQLVEALSKLSNARK